jgi:hypothetical protein
VSLTLPNAIAKFDAASRASEIPNRKTGKRGSLKTSRRAPILSNVRKAVAHALRSIHGDRAIPDAVLEATDLTPYLVSLPAHGRLAALEDDSDDQKAAGKVESNVRLFVSVVLGRDVVRDKQPVERTRVPAPYQALFDVIDGFARVNMKKRRSLRRGFLKFVELAMLSGAGDPNRVPDDFETIMRWGERAGWTRKDTNYALNAWRRAVELAGESYAMAWELVNRRGVGITSLEDFPARLRAAGYSGDIVSATAADMLPYLAPRLAGPLETVIEKALVDGLSTAWADSMRDMASWLVASLIRLGEEPARVTWLDLWTKTHTVRMLADANLQDQLAEIGVDISDDTEQRSLMRRVLEDSAARSYTVSHLKLANSAFEKDRVPVYTDSIRGNIDLAFTVTRRFFGDTLQKRKPEMWAQAQADYDATKEHIEEYNAPRKLTGRKPKALLPITWPQIVCMGVPWLARRCYELRRQVLERQARIGHLESRESQELLSRYCEALYEYAITALLTDDCLRIKNYSGSKANVHVKVTPVIGPHGRWIGFSAIRTAFSALDHDSVALKKKEDDADGEANTRDRRVAPGVVDHRLFFEFWTIARPRVLVTAGLLADVHAFDPAHDRFAVFPTPRPSAAQREEYLTEIAARATALAAGAVVVPPLPVWCGNISGDVLSNTYGFAIYRMCVELLGRDLPPWESEALTENYRGIFSGHIGRLAAATYLGGVRGDWAEAEDRTNDVEATLRRYYNKLSKWAKERKHLENPEGLRWFDQVVDRIYKLKDGDDARWPQFWAQFDPHAPERALAWLDRIAVLDDPRRRRAQGRMAAAA